MKVRTVREYHSFIYDRVWYIHNKPNKDGKGTRLYHLISTYVYNTGKSMTDVLHDAACYILNNDKTYANLVRVIESDTNIDGYLYKILYHYFILLTNKLNQPTDTLVFENSDDSDVIKSDANRANDKVLFRSGHYQRPYEDYKVANELWILLNHTAGDVLAQDIVDGLSPGKIAKKHKKSINTIRKRLRKVRQIINREWGCDRKIK